jgi:hypothetical protein
LVVEISGRLLLGKRPAGSRLFWRCEGGGAIASLRGFGHENGMNTLQPMPGPLGVAVRYLGVVVLLAAYGGQV